MGRQCLLAVVGLIDQADLTDALGPLSAPSPWAGLQDALVLPLHP